MKKRLLTSTLLALMAMFILPSSAWADDVYVYGPVTWTFDNLAETQTFTTYGLIDGINDGLYARAATSKDANFKFTVKKVSETISESFLDGTSNNVTAALVQTKVVRGYSSIPSDALASSLYTSQMPENSSKATDYPGTNMLAFNAKVDGTVYVIFKSVDGGNFRIYNSISGISSFTYNEQNYTVLKGADNKVTDSNIHSVKASVRAGAVFLGDVTKAECEIYGIRFVPAVSAPTFSKDGNTVTITAGTTTLSNPSTAEIRYTLDGTDPVSDSPVYSAALQLTDNKTIKAQTNYISSNRRSYGPIATYNFTYTPIDISSATVNLSSSSFVYNGSAQTPTVSSVVLNDNTLTLNTDYTVNEITSQTNVGNNYTVTVTGTGAYTGTASATWAITKATNTLSGTLTITGWTVGESANSPSGVTAAFGTVGYKYSNAADGSYGTYDAIVNGVAGTWYVKAYVDGTDNYTAVESEPVSFTISAAAPAAHTLTVGVDDSSHGSVAITVNSSAADSGVAVAEGATVSVSATAESGYTFKNWGNEDLTSNPYQFTMGTSDVSLTATFEATSSEPDKYVSTAQTWTFDQLKVDEKYSTITNQLTKTDGSKLTVDYYLRGSTLPDRNFQVKSMSSTSKTFGDNTAVQFASYILANGKIPYFPASTDLIATTTETKVASDGQENLVFSPTFAVNTSVPGTLYAYISSNVAGKKLRIYNTHKLKNGSFDPISEAPTTADDIIMLTCTDNTLNGGTFFVGGVEDAFKIYAVRFVPTHKVTTSVVPPTGTSATATVTVKNGDATVGADTYVEEGKTLTVEVSSITTGYEVDKVEMNSTDITSSLSEGKYSFTMPVTTSDVTVTVTLKEIPTIYGTYDFRSFASSALSAIGTATPTLSSNVMTGAFTGDNAVTVTGTMTLNNMFEIGGSENTTNAKLNKSENNSETGLQLIRGSNSQIKLLIKEGLKTGDWFKLETGENALHFQKVNGDKYVRFYDIDDASKTELGADARYSKVTSGKIYVATKDITSVELDFMKDGSNADTGPIYLYSVQLSNGDAVPVPTIGDYDFTTQKVGITVNNSLKGVAPTVYYTTDGSAPTTNSTVYNDENKISLKEAATIKAIAVVDGVAPSSVAEKLVQLENVSAPSVGEYSGGKVTITAGGTNNTGSTVTTYYTLDGSTPSADHKDGSFTDASKAIDIDQTRIVKSISISSTGTASSVVTQKVVVNAATPSTVWDFAGDEALASLAWGDLLGVEGYYYTTSNQHNPNYRNITNSSVHSKMSWLVPDISSPSVSSTAGTGIKDANYRAFTINDLHVGDRIYITYSGGDLNVSAHDTYGNTVKIGETVVTKGSLTSFTSGTAVEVTAIDDTYNYVMFKASSANVAIQKIEINPAYSITNSTETSSGITVNVISPTDKTFSDTFARGTEVSLKATGSIPSDKELVWQDGSGNDLTANADGTLTLTMDGDKTVKAVLRAVSNDVTLTDNSGTDGTYVLSNGQLTVTITDKGTVDAIRTGDGKDILKTGNDEMGCLDYTFIDSNDESNFRELYVSSDTSKPTVTKVKETADMVELLFTNDNNGLAQTWSLGYIMRKGVSGLYTYASVKGSSTENLREARMKWRPGASFNYGWVSDTQYGDIPAKDKFTGATTLQDATFRFSDGTIYTKYDWANYMKDDKVHGVIDQTNGVGAWVISPSTEWVNGGVQKQDLTVHADTKGTVLLQMLQSEHFGASAHTISSGDQKFFGPTLLYVNSGEKDAMISDANSQAETEKNAWPYSWFSNDNYPSASGRGTVTGTITLNNDDFKTTKLQIILADAQAEDPLKQVGGYQYATEATSTTGNYAFRIENIRPGNYAVFAYALNGDATGTFKSADTYTVSGSTDVGTIVWTPTKYPVKLWQIGEADHSTSGFKLSDHKRQYGLWDNIIVSDAGIPSMLTYTVGTSNPATDWYYAQLKDNSTWTINFNTDQTFTTPLHLTIALAGSSLRPKLAVKMNENSVYDASYSKNDAAIYRSGILSGHYGLLEIEIPANTLKSGSNALTFTLAGGDSGIGGLMYDCIKLEAGSEALSGTFYGKYDFREFAKTAFSANGDAKIDEGEEVTVGSLSTKKMSGSFTGDGITVSGSMNLKGAIGTFYSEDTYKTKLSKGSSDATTGLKIPRGTNGQVETLLYGLKTGDWFKVETGDVPLHFNKVNNGGTIFFYDLDDPDKAAVARNSALISGHTYVAQKDIESLELYYNTSYSGDLYIYSIQISKDEAVPAPVIGDYDFNSGKVTITPQTSYLGVTPTVYYAIGDAELTIDDAHKYTEPFMVTQACTVKAIAVVGSERSTTAEKNIVLESIGTPTIAVTDSKVTISGGTSSNPSSTVTTYYTIDGSTPSKTNGTAYSEAFTIDQTRIVKAISVSSEGNESDVMTETVVINKATPVTILDFTKDEDLSPLAYGDDHVSGSYAISTSNTTNDANFRYITNEPVHAKLSWLSNASNEIWATNSGSGITVSKDNRPFTLNHLYVGDKIYVTYTTTDDSKLFVSRHQTAETSTVTVNGSAVGVGLTAVESGQEIVVNTVPTDITKNYVVFLPNTKMTITKIEINPKYTITVKPTDGITVSLKSSNPTGRTLDGNFDRGDEAVLQATVTGGTDGKALSWVDENGNGLSANEDGTLTLAMNENKTIQAVLKKKVYDTYDFRSWASENVTTSGLVNISWTGGNIVADGNTMELNGAFSATNNKVQIRKNDNTSTGLVMKDSNTDTFNMLMLKSGDWFKVQSSADALKFGSTNVRKMGATANVAEGDAVVPGEIYIVQSGTEVNLTFAGTGSGGTHQYLYSITTSENAIPPSVVLKSTGDGKAVYSVTYLDGGTLYYQLPGETTFTATTEGTVSGTAKTLDLTATKSGTLTVYTVKDDVTSSKVTEEVSLVENVTVTLTDDTDRTKKVYTVSNFKTGQTLYFMRPQDTEWKHTGYNASYETTPYTLTATTNGYLRYYVKLSDGTESKHDSILVNTIITRPNATLKTLGAEKSVYTLTFAQMNTVYYTVPGGTEKSVAEGNSLDIDITKSGQLVAYAKMGDLTSDTLKTNVYVKTPAIADNGKYDFGLLKDKIADYVIGTRPGDNVNIGGLTLKRPDDVVENTFDRFAFTAKFTEKASDGSDRVRDTDWRLLSAGRLRANRSAVADTMAILNLKKGEFVCIEYTGADIEYMSQSTAKLTDGTGTLLSQEAYEVLADGDMLLVVPGNTEKTCDIFKIEILNLQEAGKSTPVVYNIEDMVAKGDTLAFNKTGVSVYNMEKSGNTWELKSRSDFYPATNLDGKVSVRVGNSSLTYDKGEGTMQLKRAMAIHDLGVGDEIVIMYSGTGSLISVNSERSDEFTVNGRTLAPGDEIPSGAVIKITKTKYSNNYIVVSTSGDVYINAIYINSNAPTVVLRPTIELREVGTTTATYRITYEEGARLYYELAKDSTVVSGSTSGSYDFTLYESDRIKAWAKRSGVTSDTLSTVIYAPTPAPSESGDYDFFEQANELPADLEVTLDPSKSVTVGGQALYKPTAMTAQTFNDKFAFTETNTSGKIKIRTNRTLAFNKGTNMNMALLNMKRGDIISFDYKGSISFANTSVIRKETSGVAGARAMTRAETDEMESGAVYVVQQDGDVLLNLSLTEDAISIAKMYVASAPGKSKATAIDFATAAEEEEDLDQGGAAGVWCHEREATIKFLRFTNQSDELPIDNKVSTENGYGTNTTSGFTSGNRNIAIHSLAKGDTIKVRFAGGAMMYYGHKSYGNRVSVNGKLLQPGDTIHSGDVLKVEQVDYLYNYVVLRVGSKAAISGIFINTLETEKVLMPTITPKSSNTFLITSGVSTVGNEVGTIYTLNGTDPSMLNGTGGPYESFEIQVVHGEEMMIKAMSYSSSGMVSRITTLYYNGSDLTPIESVKVDENGLTEGETIMYDLQGRRVENPRPGNIYIINGKKVVYKRR